MCTSRTSEPKRAYKVIATKVSQEAALMLDAIAKRQGTTVYTMIQLMCKVFIKLMCEEGPLSAELAKLIRVFETWQGWDNSYNLCNPTNKNSIDSAIYFLKGKKKTGRDAVMVSQDNKQTYNVQAITDAFLCNTCPGIYRRLMIISEEQGCHGAYETLDKLIDDLREDPNEAQIHDMFTDNERSDFGKTAPEGPYVRKKHIDINTY